MMDKRKTKIINKYILLRTRGYSLREISLTTGLSKSSLYGYVKDISLSPTQMRNIAIRNRGKNKNKVNSRKGKCLPGREIIKPNRWSLDLVHIVAHFMFDGRVDDDSCIYYSKDLYQIQHMRQLIYNVFRVKPEVRLRDNGIYGLTFYHVEFADYIKKCKDALIEYLNNGASRLEKKYF